MRSILHSAFQRVYQLIKTGDTCNRYDLNSLNIPVPPGCNIVFGRILRTGNCRPIPNAIEIVFRRAILEKNLVSIGEIGWKFIALAKEIIAPLVIEIGISKKPLLPIVV